MRPAEITHVVLRVGVGLLFVQHGVQKLFGLLGGFGGTPGATAPLASLMGVAGLLELVGGVLVVVGLLTRPVALVLTGEMLVAYAMVHLPQGGWPVQNGGEPALLFALPFVFLAGNGAGPLSIDQQLGWWRRADARASRTEPRRSRAA
jgi:putative oxidoreductase